MKRKYRSGGFWVSLCLGLLVFAGIAVWMVLGVRNAAEVSDREGIRTAEQAIRRAAVSYYALEGVYPATYEDLKEYGGVAVDEERYAVFYEVFSSNFMPDVTVVERREGP